MTGGGGKSTAPRRFALDQNFPEPLLNSFAPSIPEALIVPLRSIDVRLTENFEDWQILLALHHHPTHWDGLITTDTSMLGQARELAVLLQTKLTLVMTKKAGHDPIRATGLLLTHLPWICKKTDPSTPQVWILSAMHREHEEPWEHLSKLADRQKAKRQDFYDRHKLTPEELAANPLGP